MAFFLTRIFISVLVIAVVTEVAKLSDKWGGLIAALPTLPLFFALPFIIIRFGFWPIMGGIFLDGTQSMEVRQ